jgi:glutaredoxin-like protein NrdH
MKQVKGKNKGEVMLYALSTCVWCKKTKKLLEKLGADYSYEDVDLLEDEESEKVMQVVKKWNPRGSFPVIIINNKKAILGYDEEKIIKELGG